MSLSIISSILDRIDNGLEFVQSTIDCFLCIGIALAIFRTEGNCPVEKNILKISLNC